MRYVQECHAYIAMNPFWSTNAEQGPKLHGSDIDLLTQELCQLHLAYKYLLANKKYNIALFKVRDLLNRGKYYALNDVEYTERKHIKVKRRNESRKHGAQKKPGVGRMQSVEKAKNPHDDD